MGFMMSGSGEMGIGVCVRGGGGRPKESSFEGKLGVRGGELDMIGVNARFKVLDLDVDGGLRIEGGVFALDVTKEDGLEDAG